MTGMLSKSMGQILLVSAAMHILFSMESDSEISDDISQMAIDAGINFVELWWPAAEHRLR